MLLKGNYYFQFEEPYEQRAIEPIEPSSSSEQETEDDTDSDNNSAIGNAAAAVRTRRGLPPKNDSGSSLVIPLK